MSAALVAAMPSFLYPKREERLVVRCRTCNLVQYETRSGLCRRCARSLRPPPKLVCIPERIAVKDELIGLGLRLRLIRESRKLTRGELAVACGCPRAYLWKIERNITLPKINILEKIAAVLNVPFTAFFCHPESLEAMMYETWVQDIVPLVHNLSETDRNYIISTVKQLCEH